MPDPRQGIIDICTGRGMTSATATAGIPLGVINTRGYRESPKRPQRELGAGHRDNIAEGEADFTNDLSRIYVAMNTDGDKNFGLVTGEDRESTVTVPDHNFADDDGGIGPYIISKSTNQRVIARSGGTIKIVHEDGGSIMMDPDGTIQITGARIFLVGQGREEQPFVRGNDMVTVFNQLLSALKQMASALQTGGMCPVVGPNPVLGSAMAALNTTLTSALGDGLTYDMADSLSSVIKGE